MAILMDKPALAEQDFTMNVTLVDMGEQYVLHLKNGVLLVYQNTTDADADVSITCPKNALLYILNNNAEGMANVPVQGDASMLTVLMESMNQFPLAGVNPFDIVEP